MKTHIGTDTQGRVHSVAVTHAAAHDSTLMADCLHGEEAVIYGDKAYADAGRRQAAVARGVDWRVNRKARRGKRLSCADRSFNRKSNRTRACVEHAFGVIKHLWGYRKVRYRRLEKNAAQAFTLFALATTTWPGGSWPSHEGRSVCRLGWGEKNRLPAIQTVTKRLPSGWERVIDGSIF